MAWPYATSGIVSFHWCDCGADLRRLRVTWETGGSEDDAIMRLDRELNGVLHRFVLWESSGSTMNVYLYSDLGVDVLNNQGASLTATPAVQRAIKKLLDGSDRALPICVGGSHVFRLQNTGFGSGIFGTFDLYFYRSYARALDDRAVI